MTALQKIRKFKREHFTKRHRRKINKLDAFGIELNGFTRGKATLASDYEEVIQNDHRRSPTNGL